MMVVRSLADEVVDAVRQYEAADPDCPAWEAEVRARRAHVLIAALVDLRARRRRSTREAGAALDVAAST